MQAADEKGKEEARKKAKALIKSSQTDIDEIVSLLNKELAANTNVIRRPVHSAAHLFNFAVSLSSCPTFNLSRMLTGLLRVFSSKLDIILPCD